MSESVMSALERYLARSDIAASTEESYRRALGLLCQWVGDVPPEQVTLSNAEDWRGWLHKGRSERTVNLYVTLVRAFWAWMVRSGIVRDNPWRSVSDLRVERTQRVGFTEFEIGRILRVSDDHWTALTCLGAFAGLRSGEALNLCRDELVFDGERSHALIKAKKADGSHWPWQIKNHQRRLVSLPTIIDVGGVRVDLHGTLRRLMADLPAGQPYVCLRPAMYLHRLERYLVGRMTHQEAKRPWASFSRCFLALQARSGLPGKRYHELRAFHLTRMIHCPGVGLVGAQRLAGHKSIQQTAEYDRTSILGMVASANVAAISYVSKVL